MNLLELSQTLGNFGEFVGAIGVVITLAYLALQIRRNTQATQAASHHAITDSLNQGNIAMATDPELTQIYLTGLVDRASLSEVERQRFDSLFLAYFHVFDTLFFSSSNGTGAQIENDWVGKNLRIGRATIRVSAATPRCGMIVRPQADLEFDKTILRSVVKEADQNLGVGAHCREAGEIRVGDIVELVE